MPVKITFIFWLYFFATAIGMSGKTDSLHLVLSSPLSIGQKIVTLVSLSEQLFKINQEQGLAVAESAYVLSKSLPEGDTSLLALVHYGFAVYLTSDTDSSEAYYRQAEKLVKNFDTPEIESKLYNYQGLLYWRQAKYQVAADKYYKALALAKGANITKEHARALNYIAFIYLRRGDFAKAYEYFSESLKLKVQSGLEEEIIIAHNNLAFFYNAVGNPDEAIINANIAIKKSLVQNDLYGLGRAYGNLSVSYTKKNDLKNASVYAQQALNTKTQSRDFSGISYSLFDLGEIAFLQKEYLLAVSYYTRSLEKRSEKNDFFGMAQTHIALGKTNIKLQKLDAAMNHYQTAISIIRKDDFKQIESSAYLLLSSIYKAKKDFAGALAAYERSVALKDSLLGVDIRERISDLKLLYDTEQMTKEIELLSKTGEIKSTILRRQQYMIYLLIFGTVTILILSVIAYERYKREKVSSVKLTSVIAEKDKLFSILAHDLRSPFTALLGRHEILITDFQELTDEEKITMLRHSRAQLRKLFDMLENLLHWRMLEEQALGVNKAKLVIKESIEFALDFLTVIAEMKNVRIQNLVEEHVFVYADKRMIHSILQNLISNAIKFTPEKGLITITSELEEGFVKISVADSGKGLTEEQITTLLQSSLSQSSSGTGGETGYGLGLQICKELIALHGGKLFISSEIGKGSVFSFTLAEFDH